MFFNERGIAMAGEKKIKDKRLNNILNELLRPVFYLILGVICIVFDQKFLDISGYVLGIANHQVRIGEFAFHAVQSDERRVFRHTFHDDFLASDFVGIESMHRLSDFHQNVVGDIDDVVDATDANGGEAVFQPSRRFSDLHAANSQARITRASSRVFNFDFDIVVVVFNLEIID